MADTVGLVGASAGFSPVRAAAPQAEAAAPQAEATTSSATAAVPQRLSPSIHQDATTGVLVTQYLDSSGKVETQIPSEASLAYLRVGLTEEGESKPKADTVVA